MDYAEVETIPLNCCQGSTPKHDIPYPAIVPPVTVEDEIIPQPQREPMVGVDAVVDVVSSRK